jgi:hypothetical protein
MADAGDATTRMEMLLRLLAERPKLGVPTPGDALDVFAIQQLNDVSAARFAPLMAFVADRPDHGRNDSVDALAVRALLDDYTAAVRQMRTLTRISARTLDDVELALKHGHALTDGDRR